MDKVIRPLAFIMVLVTLGLGIAAAATSHWLETSLGTSTGLFEICIAGVCVLNVLSLVPEALAVLGSFVVSLLIWLITTVILAVDFRVKKRSMEIAVIVMIFLAWALAAAGCSVFTWIHYAAINSPPILGIDSTWGYSFGLAWASVGTGFVSFILAIVLVAGNKGVAE